MILGANGRPVPETGPIDIEKVLSEGIAIGFKLLGTDAEQGGFVVEGITRLQGRPVKVQAHGHTYEEAVGSAAFGAIAGALEHYGIKGEEDEAPTV